METTKLYVEYIIIGLETLLWIGMLFFICVGSPLIPILDYLMSNALSIILIIGVCYIMGLVTDRISDNLLEKRKQRIKEFYLIKSNTSIVIWDNFNDSTFAKFTLSRIRVLRSTIFNGILISFSSIIMVFKYFYNTYLLIFIILLSLLIILGANFSHKALLENYYKKTKALEIELQNNQKRNKKDKHKK